MIKTDGIAYNKEKEDNVFSIMTKIFWRSIADFIINMSSAKVQVEPLFVSRSHLVSLP